MIICRTLKTLLLLSFCIFYDTNLAIASGIEDIIPSSLPKDINDSYASRGIVSNFFGSSGIPNEGGYIIFAENHGNPMLKASELATHLGNINLLDSVCYEASLGHLYQEQYTDFINCRNKSNFLLNIPKDIRSNFSSKQIDRFNRTLPSRMQMIGVAKKFSVPAHHFGSRIGNTAHVNTAHVFESSIRNRQQGKFVVALMGNAHIYGIEDAASYLNLGITNGHLVTNSGFLFPKNSFGFHNLPNSVIVIDDNALERARRKIPKTIDSLTDKFRQFWTARAKTELPQVHADDGLISLSSNVMQLIEVSSAPSSLNSVYFEAAHAPQNWFSQIRLTTSSATY